MFKVFWKSKYSTKNNLKSKVFETKDQAEMFKKIFEKSFGEKEFAIAPFIIGAEPNNVIQFKLKQEIK